MKITNATTKFLYREGDQLYANASRVVYGRELIIIEIFTDEGVTGTGFVTGMTAANRSEGDYMRYTLDRVVLPMLIGRDPFARESIWHDLFKNTTRIGRKGAIVRAISGVDIALWDLAGKALGAPVYKLAGYHKTEINCYASGGYYAGTGQNDMDGLVKEVQEYKDNGYQAVKIKVGRLPVKEDVKRVERIRKLIGDDIELLVDANEAWNINQALQFCDGVKDLGLGWIEEPLEPDDMISLRQLCQRTNIPIAAGETEYTKYGMTELLDAGIRYLNADVTRVGGITEWLKTAAICQTRNIPLVPHSVPELHVTCAACAPNTPFIEYWLPSHPGQELFYDVFRALNDGMRVRPGVLSPLDVPGLGLEMDPDAVARYTIG